MNYIILTIFIFKINDKANQSPNGNGFAFNLFGERNEKLERLDDTLDKLNAKYGGIVRRASLIGKDFLYDKTDAEDFLPFQR